MAETYDIADECDYYTLKNKIANVLRTYFEVDDNGNLNERYDPDFTAQAAIDEIHEIIGEI